MFVLRNSNNANWAKIALIQTKNKSKIQFILADIFWLSFFHILYQLNYKKIQILHLQPSRINFCKSGNFIFKKFTINENGFGLLYYLVQFNRNQFLIINFAFISVDN